MSYKWFARLEMEKVPSKDGQHDLDFVAHLEMNTGATTMFVCGVLRKNVTEYPSDAYTFRGKPIKRCKKCKEYAASESITD